MIYFDNSATTAIYPEVLKTYTDVATKIMGNPSSLHNLGTVAERMLEASRKQIAELLGKSASEIYFTSGGTEGDNWVIKGVAFEKKVYGNHIIVSAVEHPAVKESANWLATQGFDVDFAPVDEKGFVKLDALSALIRKDTILVSVMAVNNEIGAIQPIRQIGELLADKPTISFHVDAVQAIGKIPLADFLPERVDFATFSSHKFHGPRGVGIVYVKKGKKLQPLLSGGGQERDMRSTTENVAGIAAAAKALRMTLERSQANLTKLAAMKQVILDALAAFSDVIVFTKTDDFAPNIITFGIKGVRGEVVVHGFEEHELYISTTSACSSKAGLASSTLVAMNVAPKFATSAVRISLDESNNMAEIEQFLTIFKQLHAKFQKIQ
ncbi:cysteine desulfurase family protein [Pseudolactococcus insecticola]|uniref:Aminotransferase V n=1 Tax=Pseudolactococcus insecticola TaxID=2709158 RepID=A0A6A0B6X9_9LACT|nr:cysteine desulfurase family protein [Lactococcus insecticola]GFH41022.1 aminotransferase V [Lactococcus insecticola]